MSEKRSTLDVTKREMLKKAAYAVPAVLTLAAAPSFASAGSSSKSGKGDEKEKAKDKPKTRERGGRKPVLRGRR